MNYFRSLIVLILLSSQVFAQTPVYHLAVNTESSGLVRLSYELAPPAGLSETFDDDLAQDFEWWNPEGGFFFVENGYSQMFSQYGGPFWGSGVYNDIEFDNFTLEVSIENISGGASRGLLFRCDGPVDDDCNGYGFLLGFAGLPRSYLVSSWLNGFPNHLIYWTESDAINIGEGAINVLKVVAQGPTFDFYINDIYVATTTNSTFSSGHVGFTQAVGVTARYDDLTCSYEAELMPRWVEPERGETLDIWLDEAGRPTDHPPVMASDDGWPGSSRDPGFTSRQENQDTRFDEQTGPPVPFAGEGLDNPRLQANTGLSTTSDDPRLTSKHGPDGDTRFGETNRATLDELDEFVEYRIYRDGVLIGSTEDTTFTDQLPAYGEYEYRITAYYNPEGESIPSVPATVNWQPITYVITPQTTVLPSTGGEITYDAQLFSELGQQFPGVSYRTFVTAPDQTVYGPTFQYSFTLTPFMSVFYPGLSQIVPPGAPPGDYVFTARLYHNGTPYLERSFDFDKMGP